jgi:glycosyltransferase involved in cell wall biosynthesis
MQVSLERLRGFARHHQVTVLALAADATPPPPADLPVHVVRGGQLRARTPAGLLRSYATGTPLSVWRNQPKSLLSLARQLANQPWDLVYCDHWLMWPAAELVPARRVLHLHNAEHLQFTRAAETLTGATRVAALMEAGRAARYLKRIVAAADELHLLSPDDQLELARAGIAKPGTRVFLPAAEEPGTERATPPPAGHALFLGSLSWQPNQDGLRWLLAGGAEGLQEVALSVAGGGCPVELQHVARRAGATVLGFVADSEPLYANARVFIAPLRAGSGIKIKILNALARGIPVVTTPTGVEGFPLPHPMGLRVARTPEAFKAEVRRIAVATDDAIWQKMSRSAQEYVALHFTGDAWRSWCENLRSDLRAAA